MFSRKFAAIAIAVGLVLTTAGCSFNPNPDSLQSYAPSDGSGADIHIKADEVIKLRNFVYVTNGTIGTLAGTIINGGATLQTVTINYTGADGVKQTETVDIASGETAEYGYPGALRSAILLDGKPGDLAKVSFATDGNSEWVELNVPILDGTHKEYKSIVDSLTAIPEPTESATPAN